MERTSLLDKDDRTDTLDPNDAELAWTAEIERRVEDVRSNRVELVSSEQLFRELDALVDEA